VKYPLTICCIAVLGACTSAAPVPQPASTQVATCLQPDAESKALRTFIVGIVTGVTADTRLLRESNGIPNSTADRVVQVTDARTCRQALDAMNAVLETPARPRELYVYEVGDEYAVQNAVATPGAHYHPVLFFTKDWVLRVALLY